MLSGTGVLFSGTASPKAGDVVKRSSRELASGHTYFFPLLFIIITIIFPSYCCFFFRTWAGTGERGRAASGRRRGLDSLSRGHWLVTCPGSWEKGGRRPVKLGGCGPPSDSCFPHFSHPASSFIFLASPISNWFQDDKGSNRPLSRSVCADS